MGERAGVHASSKPNQSVECSYQCELTYTAVILSPTCFLFVLTVLILSYQKALLFNRRKEENCPSFLLYTYITSDIQRL